MSGTTAGIGAIVILVMVFMITTYVVVRFAGGKWTFVEEWVGYLLVFMTYFACAYALRSGGHISVDVVIRLLPKRVRLWMAVFTSLLALVMLGFFTERSISWVSYTWTEETVSNFPSLTPMWIPSMFVVIGIVVFSIAMALYLVRSAVNAVRGIEEEKVKKRAEKEIL